MIKAHIQASKTLEILLIALALISLLIGGIGIMNAILASVTSGRTRSAFASQSV